MGAHLHLDALGGAAGDMFAAAILDLDPSATAGLVPLLRSAGLAADVTIGLVDHDDGVFRGRRFLVGDPRESRLEEKAGSAALSPSRSSRGVGGETSPPFRKAARKKGPGAFVFSQQAAAHAGHEHVALKDILDRVARSDLSLGAKARARDIFEHIGRAEGQVHGLPLEDVALHEVGSQDSVADVVTAAILLDRLDTLHGGLTGSVSSLPLGSGRVQTAHGELPVPAPATLFLLQGLLTHDDGRPGERVTPTGAGIIRHLLGDALLARRPAGVVSGIGTGFGTRTFTGLSNVLRATLTLTSSSLLSGSPTDPGPWSTRGLACLACEIDDMTAEELAWAADTLRAVDGVRDVLLTSVVMKKGRPATSLQVLCADDAVADAARAVFSSTTTLGLRHSRVERFELDRTEAVRDGVRRKTAARPGGDTTKADHDDVLGATLAERRARRQRAEDIATTGPTDG